MTQVDKIYDLLRNVWDGKAAVLTDDEKGYRLTVFDITPQSKMLETEEYEWHLFTGNHLQHYAYGTCRDFPITCEIAAFAFTTVVNEKEEE